MSAHIRRSRSQRLLVVCVTVYAIAWHTSVARAQTHIFDLATGQNNKGVLKNAGHDANWVVTAWQQNGTHHKLPLKSSIVEPGDADWSNNVWVQDFTTYPSRWIAPDPSCEYCNGNFTITYTFDLTGYNLATASFSNLYWAIDDQGYIDLNGTTVATLPYNNFYTMNAFTIPVSALVQGVNTLTITGIDSDYIYEAARLEGTLTVDSATPIFTTLYTFTGGADGSSPNGGLIEDSAGLLYGTAYSGGTDKYGTIFSYNTTSGALTPLYAFTDKTDGAQPRDKLVPQPNGTLVYGATQYGGSANAGTVYELDTASNQLTTLYAFLDGADGANPLGDLQLDSSGNLDGAVPVGGAFNLGAVFQVNPNTEAEALLYSFPGGKNGSTPGRITQNAAGLIYGTTAAGGGAKDGGTIYSLSPATGKKTILYTFQSGADGSSPNGGLALDGAGNLYGSTRQGGADKDGTLFELNPSTKQFTTLYVFTGANDGSVPLGGLVLSSQGTIWGVTEKVNGKAGTGSLFSFDTTTNTFTTQHDFTGGTDGGTPNNFLLIGSNGAIYGTTQIGGSNGFGTIYEYGP